MLGVPCCCGCQPVFTDDFNRADDTNLGADWTETAGNWAIAGNRLSIGTSTGAIAVKAVSPAQTQYGVACTGSGSANDDRFGVVGYLSDANNYYSAEVLVKTAGNGTITLYKNVAGVKTQLATGNALAGLSTDHRVKLCIVPGVTGVILLGSLVTETNLEVWTIRATDSALTGPGKCGVIRHSGTGTVTFDDFELSDTSNIDPKCPACACTVHEDNFDRADNTSLGDGWTESAGDWKIDGNRLKMVTVANNSAVRLAAAGTAGGRDVSAVVRSSASGDQLLVFLAYTNSTTFLGAKLTLHSTPGSATIAFLSGATTIASCSTTALPDTDYTLRVACNQNYCYVYLDDTVILALCFDGANSSAAGVGTGTVTGVPQFDDFTCHLVEAVLSTNNNGCPRTPECILVDPPPSIDLTISGWSNNTCLTCANLNGTFNLARVTGPTYGIQCFYRYTFSPTKCEAIYLEIEGIPASTTPAAKKIRCTFKFDCFSGGGYTLIYEADVSCVGSGQFPITFSFVSNNLTGCEKCTGAAGLTVTAAAGA